MRPDGAEWGRVALREFQCNCKLFATRLWTCSQNQQQGYVLRAARAIVFNSCLCRSRLAARPKHALALRSLRFDSHAAVRTVVEEAAGLSRTGLSGRRRIHGSGKLGDLPRGRLEVRLRAADDRAAVQPDRDPVAVFMRAAGNWRRPRSRAGLS